MIFLALLCAFLLEQVRPQRHPNIAARAINAYADRVARHFNAGQPGHGVLGWFAVVLPVCLAVGLIDHLLSSASTLLGWIWTVVVLLLTVGFRQVSFHFTAIVRALKAGDNDTASRHLAQWRQESTVDLDAGAIARLAIEEGLRGAHRFVFGPVLLAVVFGPVGAVLHRMATLLLERWNEADKPELRFFGEFSRRAFRWIDWLPSRVTATGFAIAGNFEDAFYCWRTQAADWPDAFNAAILASGAGAIGVKLGGPLRRLTHIEERPELGLGEDADVDSLDSTVGLIWRATVIWMIVILVIGVARLTG